MSTEARPGNTNSMQYAFAGKRVLITGGGQGLGRTLASKLYKDGAQIFILERDPVLVAQLRKDFPNSRAEVGDVSQWAATQKIIEDFGPLDHLVNNAGINVYKDFVAVTEEEVDRVINVNLKSLFCTSQTVAKGMIANGSSGTIVNIASLGGHVSTPGMSIYNTTKAGVIMFTKCLARELGKHNIRCNSISPTIINTPLFRQNKDKIPALDVTTPRSRQPLNGKKELEEDEVVDGILFLLSPLSSLMTGADLLIDGGVMAC